MTTEEVSKTLPNEHWARVFQMILAPLLEREKAGDAAHVEWEYDAKMPRLVRIVVRDTSGTETEVTVHQRRGR